MSTDKCENIIPCIPVILELMTLTHLLAHFQLYIEDMLSLYYPHINKSEYFIIKFSLSVIFGLCPVIESVLLRLSACRQLSTLC